MFDRLAEVGRANLQGTVEATSPASSKFARMLDLPASGVMRHADAGYEEAIACARARGLDLPFLG